MVRSTVEETLNQMLEADRFCNAEKYERSEARQDTRVGHYRSDGWNQAPNTYPTRTREIEATSNRTKRSSTGLSMAKMGA